MARAWAIVLAAGAGTRFGAAASDGTKVSVPIAGRSMISWSVEAAMTACDGVTLVVPAAMVDQPFEGVDAVVAGGHSRSASVRLFAAVIAAVRSGADAAVPALAVSDTRKRVPAWSDAGGVVAGTVDRAGLFAVQTPQAFRCEVLAAAHAGAPEATDDAALVEAPGGTAMAIPGEAAAHKVTTAADLSEPAGDNPGS